MMPVEDAENEMQEMFQLNELSKAQVGKVRDKVDSLPAAE